MTVGTWGTEPAQVTFVKNDREISVLRTGPGWAFEESLEVATPSGIAVGLDLDTNELDGAIAAVLDLGWTNGELARFADRAYDQDSPFVPRIFQSIGDNNTSRRILLWVMCLTIGLTAVIAVWWIVRSERQLATPPPPHPDAP